MVDAADLPVNFAEAYICNWNKRILGVDGPCLRFMDAHGGVPPIRQVVEVGREGGLDAPGALHLPAAEWLSQCSRHGWPWQYPTLHYMCIIHPSMQGTITVEDGKRE